MKSNTERFFPFKSRELQVLQHALEQYRFTLSQMGNVHKYHFEEKDADELLVQVKEMQSEISDDFRFSTTI